MALKQRLRLATLAVVLVASVFFCARASEPAVPDFASYGTAAERKAVFFEYLLPFVQEVNAEILKDRARLLRIRVKLVALQVRIDKKKTKKTHVAHVRGRDVRWLRRLAADYALEVPEAQAALDLRFVDEVLLRVDVIPPSLALAQAANESAWGTSRFARVGNNFFGLRSKDGSGLVPRKRATGAVFRVAAYASPRDSVQAYIRTLNTQSAYRQLWAIRAGERRQGHEPSGLRLANGLHAYSERGADYVGIIQSMIRGNGLSQYDGG